MKIAIIIIVIIALICLFEFTRSIWDKPKDTVDMMKKFETIVNAGLALGDTAKVIELRENFIKVGRRDQKGEKSYMVKQRPHNEFRVIFIREYDAELKDVKIEHVYPDTADQKEIIAQFEKEIKASEIKRS